jgi:LmbE family N-acetylglucosaminyl deacetylase
MPDDLLELPTDFSSVLCVVAHPDDMEFGGAGAVAVWTDSGKTVTYVVVTNGETGIDAMPPHEAGPIREREQRSSAALVGVKEVEFLKHPDGLICHDLKLRGDIATMIRRYRPEMVVGYNYRDTSFSGGWNSPDHRNTGRALLDAVIDAGNRSLFPDRGERWSDVRYIAMVASPHATHAVDVTGAVDAAVASLEAHSAYLAGLGHDVVDVRTPLTSLFRATGQRFGGRLSIPFELVVG